MWIKPRVTSEEKNEIIWNVYTAFAAFIGTLLAFWWTTFINQFLDLVAIWWDAPWVAVFMALAYAIVISFFAIVFLISIKRTITLIISKMVVVDDNLSIYKDKRVEEDPEFK